MKKLFLILLPIALFITMQNKAAECQSDKDCKTGNICAPDGYCRQTCTCHEDCPQGNFKMYYSCVTEQGKKYCKPIEINY